MGRDTVWFGSLVLVFQGNVIWVLVFQGNVIWVLVFQGM